MKKLKILFGTVILSAGLASCSSAYYASAGYASDDLYAVHDRTEISRRKQAEAEAQRAAAEARKAEWEARIAEAKAAAAENSYYEYRSADANPYESVLADDYESAYARRLRGFESPTYKMPSSYINARYSSAFNYVSAYDPAFYNIVVMGDQVWVEPKYITSMFGSWGTVIYSDPWYYGWNRPWGPSFSFGSWGWSFGWNSWHNPWYGPGWGPWYSSWYDPWYGPGWGWGPGWHGHGHGHGRRRDGPDDIFPAQASGEHHAAGDDAVDDGRAVVTLDVDDEDGDKHVQQQLAQLLGLVDLTTDIVQVHGKGQDKADLCQLRGLQGKAPQLVPGIVVGITRVIADGQRADAHIAQHQRGQHHAPGQGHVHRPHLHQAAVIDVGQQHRNDQPNESRACLHRRPAVIAQTGDLACDLIHGKAIALLGCPARKCCHSHYAAEDTQQQVSFIGALEVAPNVFQTKTPLSFIGSPAQVCFARPQCRRGRILLHYVI